MPDYDAIVIGAGQAGPSLALRLAGAGMKVAIVERNLVRRHLRQYRLHADQDDGRERLCRPHRRAAPREYGVTLGGPVGVDMRRVKARKDAIVAQSRDGVTKSLEDRRQLHASITATRASQQPAKSRSATSGCGRSASSSMSAAAPQSRRCPASTRSPI